MKLVSDADENNEDLGEEYDVDIVYLPQHEGSGFCYDMTCPCHEDKDNMQTLGEAAQEGHITTQEADRIYRGKNI